MQARKNPATTMTTCTQSEAVSTPIQIRWKNPAALCKFDAVIGCISKHRPGNQSTLSPLAWHGISLTCTTHPHNPRNLLELTEVNRRIIWVSYLHVTQSRSRVAAEYSPPILRGRWLQTL